MKKIIEHIIKTSIGIGILAIILTIMSGCCNRTHYDPRMKQVGCGLYQIDCKYCGHQQ